MVTRASFHKMCGKTIKFISCRLHHNVTSGKCCVTVQIRSCLLCVCIMCVYVLPVYRRAILRENAVYNACLLWLSLWLYLSNTARFTDSLCYYKNENYVIFSVEYWYGWMRIFLFHSLFRDVHILRVRNGGGGGST